MKSLHLRSPAKLNLYLKVRNKRPDGYHNLVTLFERINLFDDIYLKPNQKGLIRIECNHPAVPKNSRNLAYKIAYLLRKDFGITQGVDIKIQKQIPVAAGLAGGSSNAATVLMGLNKLWALSLKQDQVIKYAQKIGSDVPFFCYNCSWALGTQRGDKIKPLSIHTKLHHVLIVPCMKVYTKDVFGALKLKLTKFRSDVNILIHYLINNNISKIGRYLENDLEPSIFKVRPSLFQLKQKLLKLNTLGVCFSGSGPSVYAIMSSAEQARSFNHRLKKQFKQVFVVRTF